MPMMYVVDSRRQMQTKRYNNPMVIQFSFPRMLSLTEKTKVGTDLPSFSSEERTRTEQVGCVVCAISI